MLVDEFGLCLEEDGVPTTRKRTGLFEMFRRELLADQSAATEEELAEVLLDGTHDRPYRGSSVEKLKIAIAFMQVVSGFGGGRRCAWSFWKAEWRPGQRMHEQYPL